MAVENVLQYALSQGIINLSCVEDVLNMKEREEYLKRHPYRIWQGNNGKWYTYLPNGKKGRILKKKATKKAIEEDVVSYWKGEMENPTIKEVFEEWNDHRLELQKISRATHLRNKQIFNRHYDEFGKKRIKDISQIDVEDFLEMQIPRFHLTAKAFSNLKTITRGFLKRAKKRKLIDFNIEVVFQEIDTSDSDFKKAHKEDYEEVFDDEEMETMMTYLEQNIDTCNLAILLMFLTGARIGEVVALRHSDFDGNTFQIKRTETRFLDSNGNYVYDVKESPKTQAGIRTAIIPMDYAWVSDVVQATNRHEEYIFIKDGKRMSTQVIRRRLVRLCDKLGIYRKSPHKIRKTYGSILLDNHIDNRLIMEQMGHTNITCTENYYHRNRRRIEQKSAILSNIPEFRMAGEA